MRCSRCGTELPDDARFCSSCGASVAGPVAEERKFVSVLFVDVVGSTARADGADPEDVRDRNQLYYREVRERIERHGGTIEKYVGDAVMAVFGAPLARSDDAERAVRASLSILDGIAALNERDPNLDLKVRVAVCTGEAIVSVDAAPADALATGDVVNTAARLQTAAPVGQRRRRRGDLSPHPSCVRLSGARRRWMRKASAIRCRPGWWSVRSCHRRNDRRRRPHSLGGNARCC